MTLIFTRGQWAADYLLPLYFSRVRDHGECDGPSINLEALFGPFLQSGLLNNGPPTLFVALLSSSSTLSSLSHPPPSSMITIKKVAGKFGTHLGHFRAADELPRELPTTDSPSSRLPHINYYRGSISTVGASVSDCSTRTSSLDGMEVESPVVQQRVNRRPKGTYRLSDFIIARTLGTGSFGRVHLGMYSSFAFHVAWESDQRLLK